MPEPFVCAIVNAMLTNLNFFPWKWNIKVENQANWKQEVKLLHFIFTEYFDFFPSWRETELAQLCEMLLI